LALYWIQGFSHRAADCTVSLPSPPELTEVPMNSEATTAAAGSVKSTLRSAASCWWTAGPARVGDDEAAEVAHRQLTEQP
jgi:hypothetical protein